MDQGIEGFKNGLEAEVELLRRQLQALTEQLRRDRKQ